MDDMWLVINEIKRQIRKELTPIFKTWGYSYKASMLGGNTGFMSKIKNPNSFIFFDINSSGRAQFSRLNISFEEVEKILFEIKLPNFSIDYYNKPFSNDKRTVVDYQSLLDESFFNKTLYNATEVSQFCDLLKSYMLNDGLPFYEKYKSLEAVYHRLNELYERNDDWDKILFLRDKYFRGIIIFKLFNDPKYDEKVEYAREKIKNFKRNEEWLQAYDNLLIKLEEM